MSGEQGAVCIGACFDCPISLQKAASLRLIDGVWLSPDSSSLHPMLSGIGKRLASLVAALFSEDHGPPGVLVAQHSKARL